jgi:phosphoribosylglycinamide formyltransferase-1
MPTGLPRLAVLISGRGSNLQSIIDAIGDGRLAAEIALVISNVKGAPGLTRADAAGIPTAVLPHGDWTTRQDYDTALAETLRRQRIDLVCLAGFMRLLSPAFVDVFPQRILNIHPSLLPSFPGLDAQRQAFDHGVQVTGVTVHFVDAHLDAGPIVMQAAVPVLPTDTPETLAARILAEEHRVYPEAIRRVLDGGWRLEGRRFVRTRE